MGKPKGSKKTGGRKRGTPNKTTATVKEWLATLIDENRDQIEKDIKLLQPKERLQILEKLMQYVVPKTPISIEPTIPLSMGEEIRIGWDDDY